jgi:tetratricopeptide (TPR) repeat protein
MMAAVCLAAFAGEAPPEHTNHTSPPPRTVQLSNEQLELLQASPHNNQLGRQQQAAQLGRHQIALEAARKLRESKDLKRAETAFIQVLESDAPEEIKRPALLQLAMVMQEQKSWQNAQRLYSEYIRRHEKDPAVPEVLLRQAYLYREMGLPVLALSKFYAVISTCLNLKLEEMDYYEKLVLRAQAEIAETYYLQGNHPDAIEYFNRLLRLEVTDMERSDFLYKLIRSYMSLGKYEEAAGNARNYLEKYADYIDAPEARFLLADSLKKLGRNKEALEQIGALLQKQHAQSKTDPQQWLYWQQRAGNDIANQLYREGDYLSALQVYQTLAELNDTAEWQIPVWYQIGLVYENLKQGAKAGETYDKIIARGKDNSEPTPSLKSIIDMALWRKQYLTWEAKAHAANDAASQPTVAQGAL